MFSHQKALLLNLLLTVNETSYSDSDKDKPAFRDFLSKLSIIGQYSVLIRSFLNEFGHMTYMIENTQNNV